MTDLTIEVGDEFLVNGELPDSITLAHHDKTQQYRGVTSESEE